MIHAVEKKKQTTPILPTSEWKDPITVAAKYDWHHGEIYKIHRQNIRNYYLYLKNFSPSVPSQLRNESNYDVPHKRIEDIHLY